MILWGKFVGVFLEITGKKAINFPMWFKAKKTNWGINSSKLCKTVSSPLLWKIDRLPNFHGSVEIYVSKAHHS